MKTILKLSLVFTLMLVVACGSDDDSPTCVEQTWYQDADGDGFGNATATQNACTQPTGYVANNTDLNDNDANSFPNATEICDGLDNDGDGQVDGLMTSNCAAGEVCENGSCVPAVTYYLDADADGYGDDTNSIIAGSTAPNGYVAIAGDCDDTNETTNPGATDVCGDGIDNNCDGNFDENCVEICDDGIDNDLDGLIDCDDSDCSGDVACVLYADNDGDGYGDPNTTVNSGVTDNTDCDDNDADVNPGAIDNTLDGIDQNCDGTDGV